MLTLFLAVVSCDTFLHSLLFPGNRSQLGRMLTYCTSLPPTPLTLAVMMMVSMITNTIILLSLIDVSNAIDVDDPTNTFLLDSYCYPYASLWKWIVTDLLLLIYVQSNWCWRSDQYHPTKDPYVNQSQLRLVLTSLRKWPLTQRKLHRKLLQHTLTQILFSIDSIWGDTFENTQWRNQANASNVTMHLSQ